MPTDQCNRLRTKDVQIHTRSLPSQASRCRARASGDRPQPSIHPKYTAEIRLECYEVSHTGCTDYSSTVKGCGRSLTPIQLGLSSLPDETPEPEALMAEDGEPTQTLKDLHQLLMETSIQSGKLACGACGHEYAVKEGIANFLLPSHMV